jgi:hypothetical protein
MTYRCAVVVVMIASLSAVILAPAHAAVISSYNSPVVTGGGIATASGPPPAALTPNNDNSTTSPNTVGLSTNLQAVPVGAVVDIVFNANPSGGVTEYVFTEAVTNNSLVPWVSYRLALGFGTGASFVLSSLADGLDFDFPNQDPAPTSTVFPTIDHQSEILDFSGATVPAFGTVAFSFSIDVADVPNSQFTLRQIPNGVPVAAVPEPATLVLLSVGVIASAALTSRRRNRYSVPPKPLSR